ncbi:MAG: restriction endonuclease subunit S [Burkholderiales bacterium]|nr:restriction endonuclease subunit S [Burkholderiales bacterium]
MMSNWHNYSLDQVGTIVSGSTPSTENPAFWNGNINWVTPNDLSKQKTRFIYDSDRKLSLSGFKSCSLTMAPALKSLIISSRAPVGYLAIPQINSATNQGCKTIIFKESHYAEFYYYVLLYNVNKIRQRAEGTTFAEISKKELEKISFTAPDLPTQKRIAKILSTVDGQIEKTDAIIAKYQVIKQGMLHDLFTRGIDLSTGMLRPTQEQAPELYKPSPLGLIPKDWNYKTLKNITLVNQGLQIPISSRYKDYKDNRYLYITIQLLNNPTDESYTYYIDNPPISVVCKTQDVLMVRTGNTGAVITNIAGCFHNNFFKIAYNSEYTNRDFLVQYLNLQHIQEKIMNYAGTTTIPDLKHGDFYKLPYLEPKPEEQKYISAKINQIDMLIASENKTLEKLQKLKQGLMSKLLNGDV